MMKLLTKPVLLFYKAHGYAESLVNQSLLAFMPDEFIRTLSDRAYLSHQYAQPEWNEKGLFSWESEFVERHIGREPCRILVPGCGGGREAVFLARQGHEVVAFDPVEAFLDTCRRIVDHEKLPVKLFQGGYEDLVTASTSRRDAAPGCDPLTADALEDAGPYDAILLGWGSINHVLHISTLENVVRFLSGPSICPRGALLMSFWMRAPRQPGQRALGRLLMRMGRRTERELLVKGMYGRWYTREDIEDLASQAGLTVLDASWDASRSYSHDSSFAVLGRAALDGP